MRDLDIRIALREEVRRMHADDAGTLYVEELGLCQGTARVDLAVVNGSLHGYEIKSEKDTLERLPNQSDVYGNALEFVTLVASASHLRDIDHHIPSWWGIWSATSTDNGVKLEQQRPATRNPSTEPLALAQLLWKDEVLAALKKRNKDKGMKSKSRAVLWSALTETLTLSELSQEVRDCLKNRENWRCSAQQA